MKLRGGHDRFARTPPRVRRPVSGQSSFTGSLEILAELVAVARASEGRSAYGSACAVSATRVERIPTCARQASAATLRIATAGRACARILHE